MTDIGSPFLPTDALVHDFFRPSKSSVARVVHDRYRALRRRLRPLDPDGVSFRNTTGRSRVESRLFAPTPRLAVILAFGQSNIANEGDPRGCYIPGAGVYNFNLFDGRCYVARDPLLGATGDRGNVTTRLGDLLVKGAVYDRVLLVPIAYGGSYMAEWTANGRMFPRLTQTLKRLRRAGISVTHALWQQGEAEGALPNADGSAWVGHFKEMVVALRQYAISAPIFVAQGTACGGASSDRIRVAQRAVVAPSAGIFAGPDVDVIGQDERWDGCHFSTAGLEKAAQLWFGVVCAHANRQP
jgi:Carbohydrate esterase, sialic acid-specific acetylesterase